MIRRFAVRRGHEPDLPGVAVFRSLHDPHFETPGVAIGKAGVRHGGPGRVEMTVMVIRPGQNAVEALALLDLHHGVGSSKAVRTIIADPLGAAWAWHEPAPS